MASVWAYAGFLHSTYFASPPWTHSLGFATLSDLNRDLDRLRLQGKVQKLAIVSHGDHAGVVQINSASTMTGASVSSFAEELERLRWFLTSTARVIFFGCTAGPDKAGDELLLALSNQLQANREIVGFVVHNEAFGAVAGAVMVYGSDIAEPNNEWSKYAKWARGGAIIRPSLEFTWFQDHDPERKMNCGSIGCDGHRNRGERHDPYRRTMWPAWSPIISLQRYWR